MYFIYFTCGLCGLIIGLSLYYLYLVVKDKKVNMVTPTRDVEDRIIKVGHIAPTVERPKSFVPPPPRPTSVNRNTPTTPYSTPNKSTNKPPRDVDPLPLRTVSDRYDGDNYYKYESSSCSSTDSGSSDSCSESLPSSYSSSCD